MDLKLNDKGVVVLASSKGLGKACVREFAREGARVMLTGRTEDTLKQAASEIQAETSQEVFWKVCDVTKPTEINALIEAAKKKLGRIDVLVTNTGGPPAGTFDSMKDEDWQLGFDLVLMSMIRAIRAALPELKKNGGRIVNIASSSVKEPVDNLILSNTFRMGIAGLAKTLAAEFGPDGILINTVGPGRIATDRTKHLDEKKAAQAGRSFEQVREENTAVIPAGRYGTPEEFAKQVVFLGSWANTYVTGQTLLVEGGMIKAY
ncbi:SDR family oxidoreductase [Bacillus piscicola]|uniref:SDR family oxidoreductase n=1 Tax=Bacillus piscicola TaxID=1632684 RepID=UPI001F08E925